MPKKIKDSGNASASANANAVPEAKPVSDSVSIFGKLFGQPLEKDAPGSSLFSDHNPFRRKHGDDSTLTKGSSGSGSPELKGKDPDETPNNVETQKEKKKKKKSEKGKKKNKDGLDDVDSKKFLVGGLNEAKKPKNDSPSNVSEEKHQSVVKTGGEGNPLTAKLKSGKKDKKKRKRDELEEEYEAKKYGASVRDEQQGGEKQVVGKKRKNVDDPAELTISKEGYDDENKLLRTIFVGNLPLKVKKKALLREFSPFGEVESVRIRSVPTIDGKKPKKVMVMINKINEAADSVHAYIVFKTEQSASAALSHNMAVVEGNHIRVDRACPPRKKLKGSDDTALYDHKRTLFVGNLPFDVKDEELYQLFTSINQVGSSVEAVRVIRDPNTSLGKGIAYVLFKTREAVNLVVRRKNLKIRERELRIAHASSQSNTPAKRKEFQPREVNNASHDKRMAVEPKTPTGSAARNRPKLKSTPSASFEGVRASKSGTEKKQPKHHHLSAKPVSFKSQKGGVKKERLLKRPSVAARKAKDKGLNRVSADGGKMSGGGGKKRKTGSRTPQSSQKN